MLVVLVLKFIDGSFGSGFLLNLLLTSLLSKKPLLKEPSINFSTNTTKLLKSPTEPKLTSEPPRTLSELPPLLS